MRKSVPIGYELTSSSMFRIPTILRIDLSPPIHGGWQLARCKGLLLGGVGPAHVPFILISDPSYFQGKQRSAVPFLPNNARAYIT